jgi:hypothetical protein
MLVCEEGCKGRQVQVCWDLDHPFSSLFKRAKPQRIQVTPPYSLLLMFGIVPPSLGRTWRSRFPISANPRTLT